MLWICLTRSRSKVCRSFANTLSALLRQSIYDCYLVEYTQTSRLHFADCWSSTESMAAWLCSEILCWSIVSKQKGNEESSRLRKNPLFHQTIFRPSVWTICELTLAPGVSLLHTFRQLVLKSHLFLFCIEFLSHSPRSSLSHACHQASLVFCAILAYLHPYNASQPFCQNLCPSIAKPSTLSWPTRSDCTHAGTRFVIFLQP